MILLVQVLLCLAVLAIVGLSIFIFIKLGKCCKTEKYKRLPSGVLSTFNQYTGNTCIPDISNFDIKDCQSQFQNYGDNTGIYCNGIYQSNDGMNQYCDQCSPMATTGKQCLAPSCACPTNQNGNPQNCGCSGSQPQPGPDCSTCQSLNASCQGTCDLGLANYTQNIYNPCSNTCSQNLTTCRGGCASPVNNQCVQDCINDDNNVYGDCDGDPSCMQQECQAQC